MESSDPPVIGDRLENPRDLEIKHGTLLVATDKVNSTDTYLSASLVRVYDLLIISQRRRTILIVKCFSRLILEDFKYNSLCFEMYTLKTSTDK